MKPIPINYIKQLSLCSGTGSGEGDVGGFGSAEVGAAALTVLRAALLEKERTSACSEALRLPHSQGLHDVQLHDVLSSEEGLLCCKSITVSTAAGAPRREALPTSHPSSSLSSCSAALDSPTHRSGYDVFFVKCMMSSCNSLTHSKLAVKVVPRQIHVMSRVS